ncbi:carboxypeptidase regulatory-like domain-containing protein [bacterium]|nr:carboxypeptidase regulatory-like domain-containing protein [bacterium]
MKPVRHVLLFVAFAFLYAFLPRSAVGDVTNGAVVVATNSAWAEETYVLGSLTVQDGATLSIAGGSTVDVSGTFIVTGSNTTVLCQGKNRTGMVSGVWAGAGVVINAGTVTVSALSRISADAQGYTSAGLGTRGNGPCGGARGYGSGGGGGGHGGRGGDGADGAGGGTCDSQYQPVGLGSGGGCGDEGTPTGHGGGAINLTVGSVLTLDGTVTANGGNGTAHDCGGGAGGSIYARTAVLNGSGRFTANGGNGTPYAGAGGGGRIAVYYGAESFTGFDTSTVSAGSTRPGVVGTITFVDTSVSNGIMRITQNYVMDENTMLTLGELDVENGATLTIGGGSVITVNGLVHVKESSSIILQSRDAAGMVSGAWAGVGVTINAGSIVIDTNCVMSADAQGYTSAGLGTRGNGPGGGARGFGSGGGGGGYGGRGGDGADGIGGGVYGSSEFPADLGSAGGCGDQGTPTGHGGGAIILDVGSALTLDGVISANGGNGTANDCGGGSGGSILVHTKTLAGAGRFSVNGGNGTPYAGAGSGGRVAVYYETGSFSGFTNSASAGGALSRNGQAGTLGFFNTALGAGKYHLLVPSYRFDYGTGSVVTLESLTAGIAGAPLTASVELAASSLITAGDITVAAAGTLFVGGGSTMTVARSLSLTGSNATMICGGRHAGEMVNSNWLGAGVVISASNVTISAGSRMHGDAQGYRSTAHGTAGCGLGGGARGFGSGGGGGGYGGVGGNGADGLGGVTYGSQYHPIDLGSGGGCGDEGTPTGHGGSAIILSVADTLLLDGLISVNGGNGTAHDCGGGAGGSIYVRTATLNGGGRFTANGGDGTPYAGSGGGGRIAVYYATEDFTGFTNSTVSGGTTRPGAVGTIAFYDTSVGDMHLRVMQNYVLDDDTAMALGALTVENGATLIIGGGSVINVNGLIHVTQSSTMVLKGRSTTGMVNGAWAGAGVTISAGALTVDAGSAINADAQGYTSGARGTRGNGPGGGARGYGSGGGGGGYGGNGGNGADGEGGRPYGSGELPTDLGSGGGCGDEGTPTGHGGGAIILNIDAALTLDGAISANGGNGTPNDCAGGSGGSILVRTETLAGSGTFSATGGAGTPYAGAGGGGRVAVYFASSSFQRFTNCTTATGSPRVGATGTIAFFDTSVSSNRMFVYENFVFPQDAKPTFGTVTLDDAATMTIGGGAIIRTYGDFTLAGSNCAVYCLSKNRSAKVNDLWAGKGVRIAASNITVDAGSCISADGLGYTINGLGQQGCGPGGGARGYGSGGGGGGYGGAGGAGAQGAGGAPYGSPDLPADLGSAGGAGDEGTATAHGGGAIMLIANGGMRIDGVVSANGANGVPNDVAGGSGGSLLLSADSLSGTSMITSAGGNGTPYAGAGGGGRIAAYCPAVSFAQSNMLVAGGETRTGEWGTVVITNAPAFLWDTDLDLCHDIEQIGWVVLGMNAYDVVADVTASRNGQTTAIATGAPAYEGISFDTRALADGVYELRVVLRDRVTGVVAGELVRTILVNNSVAWHSGAVTTNETWSAGRVHVVERDAIVSSGARVTVAQDAVVKFAPGTRIVVATGANLDAFGTNEHPVVMTSLRDDAAGGDSNMDGNQSVPQAGDWYGIGIEGTGAFNHNEFVELRYLLTAHAGTLSGSETWLGGYLHRITGDVTVPDGSTLTIEPGAVVKFDSLKNLVVNAGGTLAARGTAAQPIVFTSVNDDSIGGDTNGDGAQSAPAPGDWATIFINGGAGHFDHVSILYGAGTGGGYAWGAGALRTSGGAVLSMANSLVRAAIYEGIHCTGGGAVTISNTVITDTDRAINADGAVVKIVNCTLDNNRIGLRPHGGTINIHNSIISRSAQIAVEGANIIRYCDVWSATNNNGSFTPGVNGNISADPRFRNADAGNYQLNFGSPCIDAADGTIAPPADFMGAPRYTDPRSPHTGVPAPGGAYADIGAFEFVENAESPYDLIVEEVNGPADIAAGGTAVVSWVVRNIGSIAVSGSWHDVIALSPVSPGTWDETHAAGEALSSAVLGPNKTEAFTAIVRVPGGTEGEWRWQVKTNARGEVFEGRNAYNNTTEAAAPSLLTVPALAVGSSIPGVYAGVNEPSWFKVPVAVTQNVTVVLDSAMTNGVCRIYAGYDRMPSVSHFDARSSAFNEPDARIGLSGAAQARTGYLLLMPEALGDSPVFILSAEATGFALSRVLLARAGNAGRATVPLEGGGFAPGMSVRLESGAGQIIASEVTIADATLALAAFDLHGAAPGIYSVVATLDGASSALPNAFTVATGTGGRLMIHTSVPANVRVGRPFTGYLTYGNDGDADISSPLLILRATQGSVQFRQLGDPGAFAQSLSYLGVAQDNPLPAVLRPGSSYTIAFEAKTLGVGAYYVRVSPIPTNDTVAMDYAALYAAITPANPHPLWASAWQYVVSECGPLRGTYVSGLGGAATRAKSFGLDLLSERDILGFMMREADEAVQDAVVRGTVYLGDTNHPLGNVLVLLKDTNEFSTNVYATAAWYDGTFGIRGVQAGAYSLGIDGYEPDEVLHVSVSAPVQGLVAVVSSPVARVSGFVCGDADGRGVLGAVVAARDSVGGRSYHGSAGTNGEYEIRLPGGAYVIDAGAEGWAPAASRGVALSPGQSMVQSFTLVRGATITGAVTISGGGVATNAQVGAMPLALGADWGAWYGGTVAAGDSGAYALGGLIPGTYSVAAMQPGYGSSLPTNIVVSAYTDRLVVDLVLSPGYVLQGTVADADTDAAIAGATVTADAGAFDRALQHTDAAGQFLFGGVPGGLNTVCAAASGYVPSTLDILITSALATVTIDLAPLGSVHGHVSAAGQPLPGMTARLWLQDNAVAETTTDAQGSYVIDGLGDGQYRITMGATPGPVLASHLFTISSAKRHVLYDLEMTNATLITGVVFAPGAAATLADASVYLVKGGDVVATAFSGATGAYTFAVLESGAFSIHAVSGDTIFPPRTNVMVASGQHLSGQDFTAQGDSLDVTVTQSGPPAPISNALVTIRALCDPTSNTLFVSKLTGESGACSFVHVPAGEYRVTAMAEGWAYTQRVAAVSGGAALAIVLEPERSVYGSVLSNASGIANAIVSAASARDGEIISTSGDDAGAYAMPSLPAGVFDVAAVAGDGYVTGLSTNLDTTAYSGLQRNFVLVPGPGAAISGRMVDAQSNAVASALISLKTAAGVAVAITASGGDGAFALRGCPGGTFTLCVCADGYAALRQQITVSAGVAQADCVFDLAQPIAFALWEEEPSAASASMRAGSGSASRFTISWLGFTYGVEDPKVIEDSFNPDQYDFRDAYFRAYEADRICNGVFEAYQECAAAEAQMDRAMKAWKLIYDKLKRENAQNVQDVLWKSAKLAYNIWSFAKGVANLYNVLKSDPSFFVKYPSFQRMFEDVGMQARLSYSHIKNMQPGNILNTLKYVGSQWSGMLTLMKNTLYGSQGQLPVSIAFRINKLISTGIGVTDLLDACKNMNMELADNCFHYLRQQQHWLDALRALHYAYAKLNGAIADCKTGDDNWPDPPPNPPNPPGPVDGGGGGSNAGGDPNDKITVGFGPQGWIRPGDTILYTVHYENVPTATAPAAVVLVTDKLDARLDGSTLCLGQLGFNNVDVALPARITSFKGRADVSTDPNPVDISAGFASETNTLSWRMASVDPVTGGDPEDPLAGFLPPNTTNRIGEGYVTFTIRPKPGLVTGDVITNWARIIFDYNEFMDTPAAVNTIDATAPLSAVASLPDVVRTQTFRVSWAGSDAGSGIASYDVLVSVDGGPFAPWLEQTTNTSAFFTGEFERFYAFYSVARDNVGNIEAAPATADTLAYLLLTVVSEDGGIWKYKHRRKVDVLVGKKIIPQLEAFFANNWRIGMAALDAQTVTNFSGPFRMAGKGASLRKWQYKPAKGAVKDAKIVYVSGKKVNRLVYKMWAPMLATNMVYITPPTNVMMSAGAAGGAVTNNLLGFVLVRGDPGKTTGWQRLVPVEIIEP